MSDVFITLGIETSCDETSASVLAGSATILSNVISSQVEIHRLFGGVVPEVAARKHVEIINTVIDEALIEAGKKLEDIDLIAVTVGPGLAVSLMVGISAARALSMALDIPAVGVNHLEGHILANLFDAAADEFPAICLLVSGGHTEIVLVKAPGEYERLGGTVDDAAGEAFDKVARLIGLGYPGGPAVQEAAKTGDSSKIKFPRPMLKDPNFNFSFSGLKTAVLNYMKNAELSGEIVSTSDVALSFQEAVIETLTEKTMRAAAATGAKTVWIAGGVAANRLLRESFQEGCRRRGLKFSSPSLTLCTDNAGMIARAGYETHKSGRQSPPLIPRPSLQL